MKRSLFFLVLFLPATICGKENGGMSNEALENAVFCLQQKATTISYAPPKFTEHEYRLKYLIGVQQKGDQSNELQLIVYGPSEKNGILYQLYLEERDHRPIFYIGEMGTLKWSGGNMIPDEMWGGVGTYYSVKRLLRKFSTETAITLKEGDVKEGMRGCVLQR